MENYYAKLYEALESELHGITVTNDPIENQLKKSILLCRKALAKLKSFVLKNPFKSLQDEVQFFRETKPLFYCRFIYFISVYNFEMLRPTGSSEAFKDYIKREQEDISRFFAHNQQFYQYYRSASDHLDQSYFTRGVFSLYGDLDDFEHDSLFSTTHDYRLSKILANEKFSKYLENRIFQIESQQSVAPVEEDDTYLDWTASKAGAVELLYAFHAAGVFNNGTASIRQVAGFISRAFNIKLGDYYRLFQDFRIRKKDRTKFLQFLIDRLTQRMDEMDE